MRKRKCCTIASSERYARFAKWSVRYRTLLLPQGGHTDGRDGSAYRRVIFHTEKDGPLKCVMYIFNQLMLRIAMFSRNLAHIQSKV